MRFLSTYNKVVWVFTAYLFLSLTVELTVIIFMQFNLDRNILYNVYLILSYANLVYLYTLLIGKGFSRKVFLIVVGLITSVAALFFVNQYLGMNGFISRPSKVLMISYILGSLLILLGFIIKPALKPIKAEFSFWFGIAQLFWSVMFLFRVGAMSYIQKVNPEFQHNLHLMLLIVNIITYLFFIKAITCLRPQKKLFSPT